MAQSVVVINGTLASTAAGSTDFTSSGFGTPDGALIICCGANTGSNPETTETSLSMGFWDGTNQRTTGQYSQDGVDISNTARYSSDSEAVYIDNVRYTVSNITDGIRLTHLSGTTGTARYVTIILFSGIDVQVGTFTPNGTVNNTSSVTGMSFEPELLLFTGIGFTAGDYGGAHAIQDFGFAHKDNTQIVFMRSDADNVDITNVSTYYREGYCCGQTHSNSLTWAGEITAFNSDGFTMTTREANSGGDVLFYMALGGADLAVSAGKLATKTTTGDDTITTTGITPAAIFTLMASTFTENAVNGQGECVALSMSDGTTDHCHNITAGVTIDESNCQAQYSNNMIDIQEETSGFNDLIVGTVSDVSDGSFTLNYTTVHASARKGYYIAFDGEVGSAEDVSLLLRHRRRKRLPMGA